MKEKAVARKKTDVVSQTDETSFLKSQATIFINYRRDDSKDEAAYLKSILANQFGPERIFRDLDSIKLGANFPEVINNTLDNASVVLVLIGNEWLTLKTEAGQPRIKARNDYVRMEIETALKLRKQIIPILLNGASMPGKTQLPLSIARLSAINAVSLSWFEGFTKIGNTIKEIEKQLAAKKEKENEKRKNLSLEMLNTPLKGDKISGGRGVIVTAMEYSLQRLGKRIILDAKDFYDIFDQFQDAEVTKYGGFFFDDMIYVVDFIGIKAKTGLKRYVARSIPLQAITDVPAQLTLKRPVICGFTAYEDWFDKKVSRTGVIDFIKPTSALRYGSVGVIISWNPVNEQIKLLTPWPEWGNKGVATISKDAMHHVQPNNLRAFEAVEKPSPYSKKLQDLSNKLPAGNKKQAKSTQ
jgi:hypothetical protein